MHAAVALLLLVGTPDAPPPVVTTAAPDAVDLGAIGLGLAGGGAALATGTVVVSTLVQSLNTPDREGQATNETLVRGSGLLATGMVSVGAAMMLAGGVLILDDVVFGPARPAPVE